MRKVRNVRQVRADARAGVGAGGQRDLDGGGVDNVADLVDEDDAGREGDGRLRVWRRVRAGKADGEGGGGRDGAG